MGDPIVIIKIFQEFSANFNNENYHPFVDIGSCSLYIVCRVFRTGAAKPEWTLKKVLNGPYIILYNTPTTRENYKNVEKISTYACSFFQIQYESFRLSLLYFKNVILFVSS